MELLTRDRCSRLQDPRKLLQLAQPFVPEATSTLRRNRTQFRIILDILLRSWTSNYTMAQAAALSSANPISRC